MVLRFKLCLHSTSSVQAAKNERRQGPGTGGGQGGKPQVPSNGQNWGNGALAPRLTFPPLAYHWSCTLDLPLHTLYTFILFVMEKYALGYPFLELQHIFVSKLFFRGVGLIFF